MALIKSISGIRGTIGGKPGENLTPIDIVKFASAFGTILQKANPDKPIIVGRDGRISGSMVKNLVIESLLALGIDVIDADYSTTPTIEMGVTFMNCAGGIIITASHNPKEWNALKLLNSQGEFIDNIVGQKVLSLAKSSKMSFVPVEKLGKIINGHDVLKMHIDAIVAHPLVNTHLIKNQNFKIVVDVINSTGAIAVPALLDALGVTDYVLINEEITGNFSHNPEPLPENLVQLSNAVLTHKAHLGIAVDPDVDRLCFVCEDGTMFGEEYTLVAVADYILSKQKGNTVSNLSSTRALQDVTEKHGGTYYPAAVGEVNVVAKMKEVNAVIGGEGNGGIIDPELHYGRDALVGIALFLTHLATQGKTIRQLRTTYPNYFMSKNKVVLTPETNLKNIFIGVKEKYKNQPINEIDGLKIHFDNDWVHLRQSNTEPIIRIYAESDFETKAENIALKIMQDIKEISQQ